MKKIKAAIIAAGLGILGIAGYAGASIQLGGSIFPLTYITTPPWNVTDAFNQLLSIINQQTMPNGQIISPPGGRLSLTSVVGGVPTGDVALESNVFYMPYTTQMLPVFTSTPGNPWTYMDIGSAGLQLTLGSADTPQTIGGVPALYDVYGFSNGGIPTICKMAWGGTTRSSTAGGGTNGASGTQDARITQVNGIWVNRTAIATGNCFGGSGTNNTPTSFVIAAQAGTLLGTINLPSTGGISQLCKGTATAGGLQSSGVNIGNVYNKVPLNCSNIDTAQTTSTTTGFTAMGNNDAITFVDSLGQTAASYVAEAAAATVTSGATGQAVMGAAYTANAAVTSTATPNIKGVNSAGSATLGSNWSTLTTSEGFYPTAGLGTVWLEKQVPGGGTATYGLVSNSIGLHLNIMY